MSRQELELFMIEFALTELQAQARSFCSFYKTDIMSVEYEMKEDHGIAYMVTPDGREELTTVYFKDVAYILNHSIEITNEPFMALCPKYDLSFKLEGEEEACQETN